MPSNQQDEDRAIEHFLSAGRNMAAIDSRIAQHKIAAFEKAGSLCRMNGPSAALQSLEQDLATSSDSEFTMAYASVVRALKRRMVPRRGQSSPKERSAAPVGDNDAGPGVGFGHE